MTRVLVVVKRRSEARPLAAVLRAPAFGVGGPVKVVAVAPRRVLPPPPPPVFSPHAWVASADLTSRARSDTARLAQRLASAIANSRGAHVEAETRVGTRLDEIVAAAVEWSAELIVLAIDETSAVDRWRDTMLARAVVSRAPASVLVVKVPGERHAARSLVDDVLGSELGALRA